MLRLIQIEFIKLKNSKASLLLIATYFILITSIAIIPVIQIDFFGQAEIKMKDQGIFDFPYIWHFNTYIVAWFKIFLLLVIVSMTANEYSNRTIKQNLIDGLSKKEFIISKFLMVIVFSFLSTLFVFVISMILGLKYSAFNEISIIFSDLEYLLAYFVKLVAFFSFGLFLGILIKRSAFAVGAMIIWSVIEWILYALLKFKYFKGTDIDDKIMQFFPLSSMYNLITDPARRFKTFKAAASANGKDLSYDYAVHWYEIAIVLVWTFLFIYFSYKLLKRRDL